VAETLCFDYNRQYGVKTKVVRIFNTYGPSMQFDDGRVVSNFILQALTDSDITIYGDGSQTRSFCYVSDLVDGLIKMIHSDSSVTGPINLGNPTEMPIVDLATRIIQETNSKSKIKFEPLPSDDPKQRKPDIGRAREVLGWEPTVDLSEGLKKTVVDFENRIKSSSRNPH
jgi:UDP-glucuronate decarboxylase